ncbi:MAG: PBSX family phage terminase large subunit [Acidobacteria bacterium]|nr:PBSX family phage terminase large subunit [Acidobacteriota bacterium]
MLNRKVLDIPTASVFLPLLEPSRYKGIHGGRGSAKSHFFAEKLIDDSICERGMLSVCLREVQKSLKDSAKRLIEQKLETLRLGESQGFKIFKNEIETPGDGVIIFQGLQDHTAESIKSLEGFKRAWLEEAQTITAHSLQLLRPTIRAEGSEIWASWNPRRKSDPIDMLLRQGLPPTNSIVVESNWHDNPWFPDVLEQERLDCLRDDPDNYEHIWGGGYATITKGAYFAKQLILAKEEGRISNVSPDPLMTIRLFADIGGTGARADNFVFWAAQFIGKEIRVINHYEVQGQDLAAHLTWLREQDYTPSTAQIWLPHDGATHDRVHSVSYESAFKQAGYKVTIIANQGKGAAKSRVEEVRRLFPSIWIDKPKCEAGLDALGWYHEKLDVVRQIGLGPDHDWSSHSADAFGLMCVAHKTPVQRRPLPEPRINIV